ncbi:putative major facilitator transporter Str1/Tri12, major facilitator superfamily [Septoria linicola]|nr:putative major facilitator transporter Str1/Tri12, major facilitator superfamily [Septoria linicola]
MEHEKQQDVEKMETVDTNSDTLSNGKGSHGEDAEGENKLTFGFFMTMLGLAMAFVVAEVTPLFFVTCFTVIAFDLGAIEKVVWILVAPYIATGAVAPFVGSLSDLMGRKGIIQFSLVLAILAFILQGAAPNFGCFLVGATMAGAAIGIQILTVIAAASELVPVSKRGATIGYIVIGFMPFAPSSLYGQLIAEHDWRYIFALLGTWSFISFVVLQIFYKPPPRPATIGATKWELLKRIDYIGSALSILGVVLFLIGINWGGADYPWNSPQVICMLVFGVVTLVIFGLYEKFFAKYPMFPGRLIQSKRHFFSVSILCFTSGVNYVPLTVFWTIMTYTVYGASFKDAGVWLLPLGFCIAGGAIVAAILITVFKRHIQYVLIFFCVMQVVGISCMSLYDPNNIATVWAPMIIGLIGVGAVLLPSQVVFSVISPDDLIGTSVALSLIIRMIGQVIGKSMFYNIFREQVKAKATMTIGLPAVLAGFVTPEGIPDVPGITKLVTTMTAGPLDHYLSLFPQIDTPEKYDSIVTAGQLLYSQCFQLLFYVSIPFGALAIASCFGLWGIDKYMTKRVAVHL